MHRWLVYRKVAQHFLILNCYKTFIMKQLYMEIHAACPLGARTFLHRGSSSEVKPRSKILGCEYGSSSEYARVGLHRVLNMPV